MNKKSADVEIRPAREDELPAAIEVLAHTFAQDRAVRSIMAHTGGQHNNVDFARAIYEIQVYGHYFPNGEVDLAIDDGEIVGVGLWARPNKQMSTPKFMALLPKYINLFRRAVPFVARREARTAGAHPRFAHWYLFAIAVSSRVQGKGIGSTMLKHGLRRAGDAPVYLEASTPKSAALYRSLGFVELGPIEVAGDKLADPPEVAMWRPTPRDDD